MWKIGSSFGNSTVPPTGTTTTRGAKALPFIVIVALAGRGFTFGPSTYTTTSERSDAAFPPFSTSSTRPRIVPAAAGAADRERQDERRRADAHPAGPPGMGECSMGRPRANAVRCPGPGAIIAPRMPALLGLLLAASIDGEAALRHASALAALGPHPWGSPRNQAAAAYVAAQLRAAGLDEVGSQDFERHGVRGANVVACFGRPATSSW